MNKLVATLVVALMLLCGAAAASAAPRGNAFCKNAGTPTHLAALVEQSLDKDPSGNTPLDPKACHMENPAAPPATPNDFLAMLKVSDPNSGVTRAAQLPAYFRSLVRVTVYGEYWSACLAPRGRVWIPLANCIARRLHKGEVAWGNPVTHKPVLQGDCSNPMQQPQPVTGCVDVLVPVEPGDEIRIKEYGPQDLAPMPCTGLKRVGETVFESPFVEHCPDWTCTFAGADQAVGNTGWQTGSWRANYEGWAVLRLPGVVAEENSGYRVFFCLRDVQGDQSCGLGVRWFDYLARRQLQPHWLAKVLPVGDRMAAVIYPAEKFASAVRTRTGMPTDLWWHFNLADCGGW